MRFTPKVIPSRSGNVGLIQLNNPKALNSLDLDMVRFLNDILPTYTSASAKGSASALKATIWTSNNEKRKAFCAGGDMKRIYQAGMGLNLNTHTPDAKAHEKKLHGYGTRGLTTADFLHEEYQLNHKIAMQRQQKQNAIPQVSIWDGIVMGGGVGLSIHGKHRVATQHTVFAMPETSIGFFCDVGATFSLPRIQVSGNSDTGIGNYIALTGARLRSDDLMYSGLATHYIPSERIEQTIQAIVTESMEENDDNNSDCAAGPLMANHEELKKDESFLARHREYIDDAFGSDKECVEDIVIALETQQHQQRSKDQTSFATNTLKTLRNMSPTSLKITLESMMRGKKLDTIADCLKMEYRMGQVSLRHGSDFYEGIRAALVDKDGEPKWNPSSLEHVTDDIVASYFESLGDHDLVLEDESTGSVSVPITSQF